MKSLKRFLTITCLFLFPLALFAQTGKIVGTVREKETGEPIMGANVIIESTSRGAASNLDGKFLILAVAVGTYDVKASAVGYASVTTTDVIVEENKTTHLVIELESTVIQLEPVTLVYVKPNVELDVTSKVECISTESLQAMAVSIPFSDPFRRRPGFGGRAEGGNEEYGKITENTFLKTLVSPLSTFSIDVDRASYSIMRSYLNGNQLPPFDAIRLEELVNYFDYDYPAPEKGEVIAVDAELSDCPWESEHQLLRIGLRAPDLEMGELPPSNFVFLIDVSGSMNSQDKLPLLVAGMKLLVDEVSEKDRIAIVVYAGRAGTVLPPTSGSEKQAILEALDRLSAGGSTAGAAGIKKAYELAQESFIDGGNNRVILATDGDFNVGISDPTSLEKLIEEKRDTNIFLTVLGFGGGNLKDNRMEILADKGNGNYCYIDNLNEAKKALVNELGGLYTVAKDVKLQIEFNPYYVGGYRLLGYENRLLADEEFDDDTKDAGEMGAGHRVTALYEIVPPNNDDPNTAHDITLRYQDKSISEDARGNGELASLAFRYKEPAGDTSQRTDVPILAEMVKWKKTSDDFRFAAAVAEFSLLLRESEYSGNATYGEVIELARSGKGEDDHGYRAEFIQLAERAKILYDQMKQKESSGPEEE